MRSICLIVMICSLMYNCKNDPNNLCSIETTFRIYDFAGLEVYGSVEDGMKCAEIQKKPVLLLFSGYACVGDKSYEEDLFINKENRTIIETSYVPVILFVDDRIALEKGDIKPISIPNNTNRKSNVTGSSLSIP